MISNPVVYQTGGGSGPILLVTVTGATATSVTATSGGQSVGLAYDSAAGKWWAVLSSTGTWTVTAYNGEISSSSTTVSASSVTVYEITLQLSELPDGYTKLASISATGTQYIKTGLILTAGFRKVCTVSFSTIQTYQAIMGASGNGGTTRLLCASLSGSKYDGWEVGSKYYSALQGTRTTVANTQYLIEANSVGDGYPTLKVNDASISFTSYEPLSGLPGIEEYLFALNNTGTVNAQMNGTIYGAVTVYSTNDDSGVLAKFCPSKRNSDSVVGMYDIIRNQFFANAGTGSFIAGPEV